MHTHIDVFNAENSWQRIRSIELSCGEGHNVTLHVNQARIYACCYQDCTIYVLSHDGNVLTTLWKRGRGNAGELSCPLLCHTDNEDALLVADMDNNPVQVTQSNKWFVTDLHPQPHCPDSVIYTQRRLYVSLLNNKTNQDELALYLPMSVLSGKVQ